MAANRRGGRLNGFNPGKIKKSKHLLRVEWAITASLSNLPSALWLTLREVLGAMFKKPKLWKRLNVK